MSTILLWLLAHRRVAVYGLLGAALIGLGLWFSHARYKAGETHGRAAIQALWDADRKVAAEAYAKAKAASEATVEADRKATQEHERETLEKLAAADARGADLARRLRNYKACPGGSAVSPVAGTPASAAPATGEPTDGGEVEGALAAHLTACERDSARLSGWQDWWDEVKNHR